MNSGWTGGQYSLVRVIFGAYLFVHFVQLLPWGGELFSNHSVLPQASVRPLISLFPNVLVLWDNPGFVTALLVLAAGLSVLLAVGCYDRAAAVGLWYLWTCLFSRNPLLSNPSLLYIGWLLLAHAFLPSAPYGSWSARGRADPAGFWRMPPAIYTATWILMALGYTYSGFTKLMSPSWLDGTVLARVLENALMRPRILRETLLALPSGVLQLASWGALGVELVFAPLALFSRLRPWLWGLMLAIQVSLITVIDFADQSLAMVMLHLFTFDPAWVRPQKASGAEMIFYDGHCGLCHQAVRFVLAEDGTGDIFRFAPLDSEAFRAAVRASDRAALPDSLIVLTTDGLLLTRSAAVLHLLRRLGGVWRLLGNVLSVIPTPVRDRVYDKIARIRHSLFRAPAQACPLVPANLRGRFQV
jgi:predicted DCC family thiol-disulfide oxidoreductase YuxK